jgi:hypothetical protein
MIKDYYFSVAIEPSHLTTKDGKKRLNTLIQNKKVLSHIKAAKQAKIEVLVIFGELLDEVSDRYFIAFSHKNNMVQAIHCIENESKRITSMSIWFAIGSTEFQRDVVGEIEHMAEVSQNKFEVLGDRP